MNNAILISTLLLFVWGCGNSKAPESMLSCDKEHQKNMEIYFDGVFDGLNAAGLSPDKRREIATEIILTTIEKELGGGSGYRETAIASAQKEADETGETPQTPLALYCLLRKHYELQINATIQKFAEQNRITDPEDLAIMKCLLGLKSVEEMEREFGK
jgi:hypothetical protein